MVDGSQVGGSQTRFQSSLGARERSSYRRAVAPRPRHPTTVTRPRGRRRRRPLLDNNITLAPGARALVGTGIAIALPIGTVGLIHPRSGLAAKTGLSVVNTPGTVDAGYRGEIKVCLINHDRHTPIDIRRGDRIAQLLVQRVELVNFTEVDSLDDTSRGAGGHGSSGGHALLHAGAVDGEAQ